MSKAKGFEQTMGRFFEIKRGFALINGISMYANPERGPKNGLKSANEGKSEGG